MHLYRLDATAEIAAQALGADAGRDPWAGGYVAPSCGASRRRAATSR